VRVLIFRGGGATVAALIALAVSQAPLGSPLFFALASVPCVVYALLLHRLLVAAPPETPSRSVASDNGRLFTIAVLMAVAFRVPLAVPRVGADNDMVRYMYDGRLQRLGYNPFEVLPADPAVAWTHTDETRRMPSIRARTPYPAAAQLFFRLVVTIHESSRAMKWALVLCDLLTIWALVAWLRATGRSEWQALVYAWNPLVILEVAHSGHIDALGALWIAISAWMLSTGAAMRAAIAFVIAVASKLLPIVLVPLYWKRIRLRDAAVGALVLAALYSRSAPRARCRSARCRTSSQYIRFNGRCSSGWRCSSRRRRRRVAAVLGGLAVARGCGSRGRPTTRRVGVADGGVAGGGARSSTRGTCSTSRRSCSRARRCRSWCGPTRAAGLRGVAPLAARASVVRADARSVAGVRPVAGAIAFAAIRTGGGSRAERRCLFLQFPRNRRDVLLQPRVGDVVALVLALVDLPARLRCRPASCRP
jgi:hypothetical protein